MKDFHIYALIIIGSISSCLHSMYDKNPPKTSPRKNAAVSFPDSDMDQSVRRNSSSSSNSSQEKNPFCSKNSNRRESKVIPFDDIPELLQQLSREMQNNSSRKNQQERSGLKLLPTFSEIEVHTNNNNDDDDQQPVPLSKKRRKTATFIPVATIDELTDDDATPLEASMQVPRFHEQTPLQKFRSAARTVEAANAFQSLTHHKDEVTLSPKSSETSLRDLKQEINDANKRLYLTVGAATVSASILAFHKLYYNSQNTGEVLYTPNDGNTKRSLGSLAGSIATGGVNDMVTTGLYAILAGCAAYGVKQFYNMINAPIKHTEKMDAIHREHVEALSSAHRKAMNMQAEDHRRAMQNLEGHYEHRLDTLKTQQKIHLDVTDTHGRSIAQLDRKTKRIEAKQHDFRIAYNQLLSDFQKEVEFFSAVDNADKRQTGAINEMHQRLTTVEQHLPVIEKKLQLSSFSFPETKTTDLLDKRKSQPHAHTLQASTLSSSGKNLTDDFSPSANTSNTQSNLVPRVQEQLIPQPKEKTCCSC